MSEAVDTAAPSRRLPSARTLGVLVAVVVGTLIPLQSRINGGLAAGAGDDGYVAAAISFGSGLVLLTVLMAINARGRQGVGILLGLVRSPEVPWWFLIGGACGSVLVLSQGLAVGILGVALFTVALVAGQSIGAAYLDRRGLGTMPGQPLTRARIIGSVVMVGSVVLAVSGDLGGTSGWVWMVMPLVAGLLAAFQQGINGQVRQLADSTLIATWNNFLVGFAVLLTVFLVHAIARGFPTTLPSEPWLYLGGLIGCIFIGAAAAIVQHTGVLMLGLATIAGQLLGSAVLDLVVPPAGYVLHWTTLAGTGLGLVAVGISAAGSRRS